MASGGGNAAAAAAKDVVDAEVVIVGGGIAGLATALALRRAGAAACGVLVLARHRRRAHHLPQRLVCARRRAQARLPLRRLRNVRASRAELKPNSIRARFAMLALDLHEESHGCARRSKVTNLETGATQVFRFAGNKNK